MNSLVAALRTGCFILLFWASGTCADVDESTDLFLTFGQSAMNDSSPYPYHESVSAWYETFLKVAVRITRSRHFAKSRKTIRTDDLVHQYTFELTHGVYILA